MNQNIYNIAYNKLTRWCTPPVMRVPIVLALAGVLAIPFAYLYNAFLTFRAAKNYILGITPQVCYLEKLLNDRYDNTARQIYITDGLEKPLTYIYVEAESKPLCLGSKYIYTPGETSIMSDDFIIWVPVSILFEEAEMSSLVKAYKLAGTKFKIQRF